MAIKDCLKFLRNLDPDDASNFNTQLSLLTDAGVPIADAYTQAAELVMEDVLAERNALAGEIADNGGVLQTLDIEHLLNPASYGLTPAPEPVTKPEPKREPKQPTPQPKVDKTQVQRDKGVLMRERRQRQNHRNRVRRWLSVPMRRLGNRVPVEILDSTIEAPIQLPEDTVGYAHKGTVYLFADNIGSQATARQVLEHEAIGHLGLEGSLGRRKFNELLGDVMNLKVEIMMDPDAHPDIQKLIAGLKKTYVDKNGDYALDSREEAREILAHIAHSKPRLGRLREIYNKLVAWVKQWASHIGLADPDMARIEGLLSKATAYARSSMEPGAEQERSNERPALMRRQENNEQQSDAEQEVYKKLGLGAVDSQSLWQKISGVRMEGIKAAVRSASARGYEGIFDGLIEVKRKEKEAGIGLGQEMHYIDAKTGVRKRTVDYAGSSYVAMRLATGVSDMMTHLLHHGSLQWTGGIVTGVENTRGFLDVLGDLGHENLNDWLVWMGGNRADELMRQGREHNLDADQVALAKTKNRGNEELFTRIKNEYNAMNKMQLDFAEEAGLINGRKRREWESDWYVPFYRQTEDELTIGPKTKRGLSHQTAGIRRLIGAELPTADLLENVLANWIKLTDAGVKNHALRLMVDNFKDTDYIENETPNITKAMVTAGSIHSLIKKDREFADRLAEWLDMPRDTAADAIVDAVNDLNTEGLREVWQVVAPKDPDIVRVQRDGKNEYWRIKEAGLLRATGHISETGSQSKGMKAARWFKGLLTTGVTVAPDFMLRNFIRDAAHSWAINKDNMAFAKDSFKGLVEAAGEGPVHRAMMAAGASFQGGYVHGTDPEATTIIMRRELEKAGLSKSRIDKYLGSLITTPGKLESVVLQGWQKYRDAGDKIENASRIATAEAGRAAGKPDAQWLFESKDLMDYSRRGNFAMLIAMTDVLPFLNARMQGLDKLGRAIKADPKMVSGKMAWIAGFSIALALLNDDDDRYQGLPDWEKDAYWHFYVGDDHWRIPKPFEIGFLAATIPERMFRAWVTDSQPNSKVKWALMHGTMETLNINPIPQIALPVAEVVANRSFYFDRPIESMSDQRVIPKERYNSYTSETAISLSEVGLGSTKLPEWLQLSPKQIQHLWNGYTGTMGSYALQATDILTQNALGFPSSESTKISDLPIAKSFYRGDKAKMTQWQTEFYDRLKEVQQLYGTLQKYRKSGEADKFKKLRQENFRKLKYRRSLERTQRNFSQLRKLRDKILRNDTLSAEEKYRQSQDVQVRINALAKKVEARTREAFTD